MELAVDKDLAFRDVAGKIGNGMGDVCGMLGLVRIQLIVERERTIVGHGQDWDLGDGSVAALYTASTLVDGRQICVHVTWVTATTWHFLACC